RKSPCGPLEVAGGWEEGRPDDSGARACLREVDEPLERTLRHPGIGVQQEHVRSSGLADAYVPAGAEAAVLRLDDPDVRVALTNEGKRAVGGAVVDDDRLDAGD